MGEVRMILKQSDDKSLCIEQLEELQKVADGERKSQIENELRSLRAGIKGEAESAYLIDFHYGKSKKMVVIHDLRIEVSGRVAQIDHLLIHRTFNIFVLESKHFHAGVKISEDGEFLRRNGYKRTYEGMSSPLAQNERHIDVLKDAVGTIEMPTRLGVRLSPVFHSYILVSPNARIVRPGKFDASQVIKADVLDKTINTSFDKAGFFDTLGSVSRLVSEETLLEIGKQLISLHQPAQFDYSARFGIPHAKDTPSRPAGPQCRACGSKNLSILHGRYGYYFKCTSCEGNTPIKTGCGQVGHQERIRKQGLHFYRECSNCGSSSLFYINPT